MAPLAHSARPELGIPAQEYGEHIAEVRRAAVRNAEAVLRFGAREAAWLAPAADWAACFHDLGKLHAGNQRALGSGKRSESLEVNHVDAGTAYLVQAGLREPAIAVYGHHIGLVDFSDEKSKQHQGGSPFRDSAIRERVEAELGEVVRQHRAEVGMEPGPFAAPKAVSGLDRRLLLSCLVDADHSDTARHYRESVELDPPAAQWDARLAALDAYVAFLAAGGGERTAYRTSLYQACRAGDPTHLFTACDSPVGSGKTTAVMAYLLRTAIENKLRHVFVVLPYTNIIRQSVKTYQAALCLPGEDPESVVAAHHHLAEFQKMESRHLTALWRAPVIVTTAVQFFETLGAAATGRLRKLHELPGSAVFVDEAHAAMPVHLWPYMWNQLEELAERWRCRFVMGSGSLAEFWKNQRLEKHLTRPRHLPVLASAVLRRQGDEVERERVEYKSHPGAMDLKALTDWIDSAAGPRVVVMNTVQSAALVAQELAARAHDGDVLHLSTALAPVDRDAIVRRVEAKLEAERNGSWTLVATSCVEAGLDFDFAVGFRERARAASLVQLGGRVNRHGKRGRCPVWDFTTNDPLLNQHPAFGATRRVVEKLFRAELWNRSGATELMTKALDWELIEDSGDKKIESIAKNDKAASYRTLAEETRLIRADTRLVVVDSALMSLIRHRRQRVDWKSLMRGSVQLWSSKIDALSLEPVPGLADVYEWAYEYDPEFLGIMAGALRLAKGNQDGYFLI